MLSATEQIPHQMMPSHLPHHSHLSSRQQRGAGLVEVLVALIVIGVGMLGIASLYVITLQAKTTSKSRMQAVSLAADMADRIRANSTAGSAYSLATLAAASAPSNTCIQSASANANQCLAAEMAATDLNQWALLVNNILPGSHTGTNITVNGSSPSTYTITLKWTEPNSGTLTYQLEVQI